MLAEIAKQHGIEWEQKGTHEEHLDIYNFKKKERGMIRIATVEYIAVVLTADIIIRAIEMVVSIINKKMMLHSGVVKPHNN